MANYLVYPFKTMRITQSYTGTTSHLPHTTGNPKDYPIDEGGKDGGRDPYICPCDEVKVVRIYGVGNRGTNTLWIESTTPVITASGKKGIFCDQITHPNDSDFKNMRVGKKFKRGEIICYEGTDGASGNHIHHSAGLGHIKNNGWVKNSKGKYVLSCDETLKPEDAYIVDTKITKVVDNKGLKFKTLDEIKKAEAAKPQVKYTTGTYKVTGADVLKVRAKPSVESKAKTFEELTPYAQSKIKALNGNKPANGYVKGIKFDASNVYYNKDDGYTWGETPSGWVALNFCTKTK